MLETREGDGSLAEAVATAMVGAIGSTSWSVVQARFEATFEVHSAKLAETVQRIAGTAEGERPAARRIEAERWAGRLESDLDKDPQLQSAALDFLRASGYGGIMPTPTGASGIVDGSNSASVNGSILGNRARVIQRQRINNRTFIPVFGPLFSSHPVAAAAVSVVVIGVATVATVAAHSSGASSAAQNIQLEAQSGYDFTVLPPKPGVGTSSNYITYNGSFQGGFALADPSNGDLAEYTGTGAPIATQCESDVKNRSGVDNLYGLLPVAQGMTVCFVLDDGEVGYMDIEKVLPAYLEVNAAFLGTS